MSVVLAPPLDVISREARPYPAYYLKPGMTGLALFAAAFLGHNDAIHFARNEMHGTCVDIDAEKLTEMEDLYPADWQFVNANAWEFAGVAAANGQEWDVVSVDTFTGDAMKRSIQSLDLWCSIARKVVTATVGSRTRWTAPEGWNGYRFPRSPQASWLVLTRD